MFRLLALIYLGVGLVVASQHHYLKNLNAYHLNRVVSAMAAIVAWPLVLLHVSLHIH